MDSNSMDGMFDFDQEMGGYALNDLNASADNSFDHDFFNSPFVNPSTLNNSGMDSEAELRRIMNLETPRMDNLQTSVNGRRSFDNGSEFPFPGSSNFTTTNTTPNLSMSSHTSNPNSASHSYNLLGPSFISGLNELPAFGGVPGQMEPMVPVVKQNNIDYNAMTLPDVDELLLQSIPPQSGQASQLQARGKRSQIKSSEIHATADASTATTTIEAPDADQPAPKRKRGARKKIRTAQEEEHRRQMHLKRNREAAQKCRAKKKGWEQRMQSDLEDQRRENQRLWDLHEEVTKQYDEMEQFYKTVEHCAHGPFKDQVHAQWNAIQKRKLDVEAALADIRNHRAYFPRTEYEQDPDNQEDDEDDDEDDPLSRRNSDHTSSVRSISRPLSPQQQPASRRESLGMNHCPTSDQSREYMLQESRRDTDSKLLSRVSSNDSAVADMSKSSKSPDIDNGSVSPCTKTEDTDSKQQYLPTQRRFAPMTAEQLMNCKLPDVPWEDQEVKRIMAREKTRSMLRV